MIGESYGPRSDETFQFGNETQDHVTPTDPSQEEMDTQMERERGIRREIDGYFADHPEVETLRFSHQERDGDIEPSELQARFDDLAEAYDGVLDLLEECFGEEEDLGSADDLLQASDAALLTQHDRLFSKARLHPLKIDIERLLLRLGVVEEALIQVRDMAQAQDVSLSSSREDEKAAA